MVTSDEYLKYIKTSRYSQQMRSRSALENIDLLLQFEAFVIVCSFVWVSCASQIAAAAAAAQCSMFACARKRIIKQHSNRFQ